MFMKCKLMHIVLALSTISVIGSIPPVYAQELPSWRRRDAKNPQQGREADGPYTWRMISTRYMEPSLLVWWLNPLDQPEPVVVTQWLNMTSETNSVFGLPEAAKIIPPEDMRFKLTEVPKPDGPVENLKEFRKRWHSVTTPAELAAMYPKPSASDTASVTYLPPGIDGLTAFDSVRRIWVRGTEEGHDNLRLLIDYLDRPRQRVEYQVQLIELAQSTAQTLFSVKPTKRSAPLFSASSLNRENQTKLAALVATKRATVVQSKLLSTLDKIPAPITLESWVAPADKGVSSPKSVHTAASSLQIQREMFLTPSVNADNSVVTTLHLRVNAITAGMREGSGFASMTFATPTSRLEARTGIGDTIVIAGSNPDFVPKNLLTAMIRLSKSEGASPVPGSHKDQSVRQQILVVTPRVVPAP